MKKQVTHSREEETIDAKARWFQSLSLEERADLLNSYTDMILEINPKIVEQKVFNRLREVFASFQRHKVKYLLIHWG